MLHPLEAKYNEKTLNYLTMIAKEGIHKAASGFGEMLGQEPVICGSSIRLVAISELASLLDGPEAESVGIYLQMVGDIPGQILIVVPFDKAMALADLLMFQPVGTSTTLGRLECSALAELGNLAGTFFLNSIAEKTGANVRPSVPAVMVDMLGAILDIVIAIAGGMTEQILLLQACFKYHEQEMEADFWVIPDSKVLDSFVETFVAKNG